MKEIFGIIFFACFDLLFIWWTFLYFDELGSYIFLFIGFIIFFTYGIYENIKNLK